MMIRIKTETDRIPEAINFAKRQIADLDRKIRECDYIEDINGKLIYCAGSYSEERREYEHEKAQWETMLKILTFSAPCSMLDY